MKPFRLILKDNKLEIIFAAIVSLLIIFFLQFKVFSVPVFVAGPDFDTELLRVRDGAILVPQYPGEIVATFNNVVYAVSPTCQIKIDGSWGSASWEEDTDTPESGDGKCFDNSFLTPPNSFGNDGDIKVIQFRIRDDSGIYEYSNEKTVRVDNKAPTVSFNPIPNSFYVDTFETYHFAGSIDDANGTEKASYTAYFVNSSNHCYNHGDDSWKVDCSQSSGSFSTGDQPAPAGATFDFTFEGKNMPFAIGSDYRIRMDAQDKFGTSSTTYSEQFIWTTELLADEKYSPVYRWLDGDRAWIWAGTLSDTEPASVKFELGDGNPNTKYSIVDPGQNTIAKFEDVFLGPARVTSDQLIYSTLKVKTNAGFLSEYVIPDSSSEGTEFYYPVYRWLNNDKAWIWLANNSDSVSATVNIEIGGVNKGNYIVGPEQATTAKFPNLFDGPVKITSNNPIISTMKLLVGGGINEMAGIGSGESDTQFNYPVYRWKDGDRAWIWMSNPSAINSANVTIKIGGIQKNNFPLPPGQSVQVKHVDLFEGPVEITSTEPIFSTLKSHTNGVINEFPGIRPTDIALKYSFPVYRWADGDRAWVWISNPSTTNTANITVKIAGTQVNTFPLPAGQTIQVKHEGVFDGPLVVESNEPIYATLKSRVNDAVNEFVGIH